MLLAGTLIAVVAAYYLVGCLRFERATTFRFSSPPVPAAVSRWRMELRPGRVLQVGQCRPGGLEICTETLPFAVTDQALSTERGLPLAPTDAERDQTASIDWHALTNASWQQRVDDLVLVDQNGAELMTASCASEDHALWWFRRLDAVKPQSAEPLTQQIMHAAAKEQLDREALERAANQVLAATRNLRRTSIAIFSLWFIALPTTVLIMRLAGRGLNDTSLLLWLATAHVALLAPHLFLFWRAHRSMFATQRTPPFRSLLHAIAEPFRSHACGVLA